jgi:two-component system, NtrC family, sensor kinase
MKKEENIENYDFKISHLENVIEDLENIIRISNMTDSILYGMNYRILIDRFLHDLKHSLFGISMNLQLLDDKITLNNEKRKIHECLSEIQKQSWYISVLSDNFFNTKVAQIDINNTIQEAGSFSLRKFNIHFKLIRESNIPDLLLDRAMFSMAIFNLLNNAVESIRERKTHEEVEGLICIKTFFNKGDVIISIEDNGQGIKNEIIDKIYDLGFSTKSYSTGMGLYFVRNCVEEQWGGQIQVQSTYGKGAIFTIKIPVNRNFK